MQPTKPTPPDAPGTGRAILLLFLLVAAMVPLGSLAQWWAPLNWLVSGFFASEPVHIVAHFSLFALIGNALCRLFPRLRRDLIRYLLIIFLLGAIQEWLQLVTAAQSRISLDEIIDLGVDLGGGLAYWISTRFGGAK